MNQTANLNIILLGESGVGKTSILRCYAGIPGDKSVTATIAPGLMTHSCVMEGTQVRASIWDTAGLEVFRNSIPPSYFRRADGCILVCDVNRAKSFTSLGKMREEVLFWSSADDRFPFVVLANKIDTVSRVDRRSSCSVGPQKMPFFHVSAHQNINITRAIERTIELAFRYHQATKNERELTEGIELHARKRLRNRSNLAPKEGWWSPGYDCWC